MLGKIRSLTYLFFDNNIILSDPNLNFKALVQPIVFRHRLLEKPVSLTVVSNNHYAISVEIQVPYLHWYQTF